MKERKHFKRHRDDDIIDAIRILTVPRFKTSGMSGDEWRTSAVIELRRKGTLIYSRAYHNMDAAAAHLPWLLKTWCELGDDEIPNWAEQINRDRELCHQPGCAEEGFVIYKLKREYSNRGDLIDEEDTHTDYYRTFCEKHSDRGDCGREDAERNYETVHDPRLS